MAEKTLRIAPDWECWPTWLGSEESVPTNIDPGQLGLSQDCLSELTRWNDWYQSKYRPDDPRESGFKSPSEVNEFDAEGRRLAQKVAAELGPHWRVDLMPYTSDGVWESFYANAR